MPFDPDRFRHKYPGRTLPELRFCAERQRWHTDRRLAAAFGAAADNSDNALWSLFDHATPLSGDGIATDGTHAPRLGRLLALYEIDAGDELYVEWYLGEQARVGRGELLGAFDAYWERGVDDMAVFDDSFEWVLYFTRDGRVRLLRAGGPTEGQE